MRLLLASLLLTLVPVGAAQATVDGCDDLVVDRTAQVDVPAVRRAALQVQRHAAEVRVRVFDTVPGGDLDAQEATDRAACPTWRKPNGHRRENLIVVSLSISDRKVGLYYGSAWTRDLRRRWTSIQAQAMSPSFRQDQWTEGLVGGLRATARAIDPMRNPSGSGDGSLAPPVFTSDDDPRPTDDSGGEAALALLVVAGLVGGGLVLVARNRGGGGGDGFGGGGGGGSRFESAAGFFAGSMWGSGRHDSTGSGLGGGGGHHGGGGGGGGGHGGGGGGGSSSF